MIHKDFIRKVISRLKNIYDIKVKKEGTDNIFSMMAFFLFNTWETDKKVYSEMFVVVI